MPYSCWPDACATKQSLRDDPKKLINVPNTLIGRADEVIE